MAEDSFREEIAELVTAAVSGKLDKNKISALIETPQQEFGDYAFPCFALAKAFKKSPYQIASELADKIKPTESITKVEAKGPYVNFFADTGKIAAATIARIMDEKNNYGSGKNKNKKVVIEYPSPNTNKPLHLGHVRNMLLGQSLSRILSFSGCNVFQVNLNNDRGIHICKAMLAYKLFGRNKNPEKKPDHFVGDFYVLYGKKAAENPELEIRVQEMLQGWEKGDKETIRLWKKINSWALEGFKETYKTFGIEFDRVYNESGHYLEGKKIVLEAYKKGLLKKDDKGNILAELKKYGMPDKVLLRADGTSIYITQDINLAKLKYNDFRMDKSIYVVGSEQVLHFRQLFKILQLLKIYGGELYHLAHGMVYLPEGKMKSREGKVVDADNLVEEMISIADKEIKKRYKNLSRAEIKKRSMQIGIGSIRFFVLKYDPLKDFVFNPEESISFEGETGPYVQYAHARICSVLEKHGGKVSGNADFNLLKEKEERFLIRLLSQFPATAEAAANNYKPLLIARYLLDLSQAFNNFYHQYPILKADEETKKARLLLIAAVKQVLKNGLNLLAIEAPERM